MRYKAMQQRHIKPVLMALCLITIMGFFTVVTEPARAIVPLIVAGYLAVALIGVAVGALVSWYITTHFQKLALITSVGIQYVNDTATEYTNLMRQARQEYINEEDLIGAVQYYFMRKAEYASQYYVNETAFPYQKVLDLSGLTLEYENLINGTVAHMENLNDIPEGYAESTFTGDLADFTVSGVTQPNTAVGTISRQRTDLESADLAVGYGFHVCWGTSRENPSPLTWTLAGTTTQLATELQHEGYAGDNRTIVTSSSFTLPANSSLRLQFKAKKTSGVNWAVNFAVIDAGNSTVIKSVSQDMSGTESTFDKTLSDIDTVDRTVKILVKEIVDNNGAYFYIGDFTVTTDLDFPTIQDSFMPMLMNTGKLGVSAYDFHNSTGTQQTVDYLPFEKSVADYTNAMKVALRNAMIAGQAYHSYLRGLGYRAYGDIVTTIPSPSLLFPPTNATLYDPSTIGYMEWYAILASYMISLKALFENATIGRQIGAVNFTQIDMINLPVYCEGYLYAMNEPSNTSTPFLSSIWILPTLGSLTIVKNHNTTLGVPCQVVYQENATRKVVYALYDEDDILNATTIHRRAKSGTVSSVLSVTIQTTTLDKYATDYITGYEGLDMGTTGSWDLGLMMPIFMMILLISVLGGIFTKKRNKD